jgi:hypothetical protein
VVRGRLVGGTRRIFFYNYLHSILFSLVYKRQYGGTRINYKSVWWYSMIKRLGTPALEDEMYLLIELTKRMNRRGLRCPP